MSSFPDAKANKPPRLASIQALLEEPEVARVAIARKLRAVADEIGDRDPIRSLGMLDAADIIEHGHAWPQGIA